MSARAFVDDIDQKADRARLVLEDGATTLELPAHLLPQGTREGGWVSLALTPAEPPPDDSDDRRKRLTRDDDGGDFSL